MPLTNQVSRVAPEHSSTFTSKKHPAFEYFRSPKLATVVPASRIKVNGSPETISSGIRELDLLTGGIPRGCLTEVYGSASSGRTSMLLSVLAAATQRNEVCALVDVSDALDPISAQAAGVEFDRLLWVRCSPQKKVFSRNYAGKKEHSDRPMEGPVEQALRVTDLLLQSGGFGLVIIDLGDVPVKLARRIPLTSWFRFQRAVENTPTVLFVVAPVPCAQSCAYLLLRLKAAGEKISAIGQQLSAISSQFSDLPSHSRLFEGLQVEGELIRSRMERKPMHVTRFATKAVRAG
ncbi:MAG: hypothetical protein ACRD2U_09395 [Terriglobales bacterium]